MKSIRRQINLLHLLQRQRKSVLGNPERCFSKENPGSETSKQWALQQICRKGSCKEPQAEQLLLGDVSLRLLKSCWEVLSLSGSCQQPLRENKTSWVVHTRTVSNPSAKDTGWFAAAWRLRNLMSSDCKKGRPSVKNQCVVPHPVNLGGRECRLLGYKKCGFLQGC